MAYIITKTDKFSVDNILREEYTRKEAQPIIPVIDEFMGWIKSNGYSMEKWIAR